MPEGIQPEDITEEENVVLLLKQITADVATLKKDRARLDEQRERDRSELSDISKELAVTNERLGQFIDNYETVDNRVRGNEAKINYGVGAVLFLQLVFAGIVAFSVLGG